MRLSSEVLQKGYQGDPFVHTSVGHPLANVLEVTDDSFVNFLRGSEVLVYPLMNCDRVSESTSEPFDKYVCAIYKSCPYHLRNFPEVCQHPQITCNKFVNNLSHIARGVAH
jgi:hypothetical protein